MTAAIAATSPRTIPKTVPAPGSWIRGNKPKLFEPVTTRGLTIKNRIWVAPMCQYTSKTGTGIPSDWHLVHLGQYAIHGAGLVMTEASAVLPNGRISPEDVGIWGDEHIEPHRRLTEFAKSQGAVPAIQIAHAGRKASTYAPWKTDGLTRPPVQGADKSHVVPDADGGFGSEAFGPSAIPFSSLLVAPQEISVQEIEQVKDAFVAAAKRSVEAGYQVVEIHGAHGYLLHEFTSPFSNKRTDKWGGSFENRIRLPLEIAKAIRAAIPDSVPLFYRLSASEWSPDGEKKDGEYVSWGEEQTALLAEALKEAGVDLIDTSSGGNNHAQQVAVGPLYQVPFAHHLRQNPKLKDILISAVGLITTPEQAEDVLQKGDADVIFLARELLRDPTFVTRAAYHFDAIVSVPHQYERAHTRLYAQH